jgi:uridine kinase
MKEFRTVLLEHWQRYPLMEKGDLVKLILQSEFGTGHFLPSEAEAWARLRDEYVACQRASSLTPVPPLFEGIGGGYCRVNLRPLPRSGVSLRTVARWFVRSAKEAPPCKDTLEEKLQLLLGLARSGEMPIPEGELEEFLEEYRKAGYPGMHHSAVYREAYQPAYRVVRQEFARFASLFAAIDGLLDKEPHVVVAIDGNSGAGKSFLADLLGEVYDCNIFHMDDFFVPSELKSKARLEEPGGNVHYERFAEEVLQGLKAQRSFTYGVFDCGTQRIARQAEVLPKRLNIIEGSYSMHPAFGDPYHLKVFLKVSPERQRERIIRRSGEALLRRFVEEWIPLENRYFDAFGILAQADLVFHT